MEKKTLSAFYLVFALCFNAECQSAFDEKLKSLYRNTVPLITVQTLQDNLKKGKKVTLLDIRSLAEYHISHLPSAKFIDYKSFRSRDLDTLSRKASVVVYCSVGY